MALARAIVRVGRRRLLPQCSCLSTASHVEGYHHLNSLQSNLGCCPAASGSRSVSVRIGGSSSFTDVGSRNLALHYASRRCYASAVPPHQALGMPSLSPTMTQGNIVRWRKKEGDQVAAGDVLCEIETDKATVDMESMEDGYLAKILYPDGSKDIKVGETIAVTVDSKEDIEKFKDYKPSSDATPAPTKPAEPKKDDAAPPPPPKSAAPVSVPPSGDRVFASPNAKKYASEHQIPLTGVKGTGPDGRIIRADIVELQQGGVRRAEAPRAQPSEGLEFTDMPNSQIRKVIAQRLLLSKQTIPHYYLTVDVCVDNLIAVRTQLNTKLGKDKSAKKLSINDFVLKAAALALKKVPECNSSWSDDFIRQFHNVNISVAVQTERGLVVPVVKEADKKGLGTISEDVRTLADKARQNSLKPSDYEGGTFTVSNLGGPFGIKQFCAIINPPQSCILAVGTTDKRIVPGDRDGDYNAATFMSATLSCDHRVVDGAIGAQWLAAFKGYIEDPMTLLL